MSEHKQLGEYLVNAGLLSQERLQSALRLQKQKGGFFGQILVEKGWISEEQLCQSLSEALQIHWASIDCIQISQDVLKLVPKSIAMTCNVFPIFAHNNTLHLAMENPCDTSMIQFIEFKAGMQVKPLLAPLQQLRKMIRKYYHDGGSENFVKSVRGDERMRR